MSDWLVWPLGILAWLVLGVALFVWREVPGLRGQAERITLSYWMYSVSTKFPLFVAWLYLNVGMLLGGLSVHFYWHWCPSLSPLGG